MRNALVVEQLDVEINGLLSGRMIAGKNSQTRDLLEIASILRELPREGFKATLKADLLDGNRQQRRPGVVVLPRPTSPREDDVPAFLGSAKALYPAHRGTYIASFVLHAAAIALVISSGAFLAGHREEIQHNVITLLTGSSDALPPTPQLSRGGGGGGDHDKLEASKGALPKAAREQLAPPMVVVRNEHPKLEVQATVVAPPDLRFSQMSQLGDPLSPMLGTNSNGTGSGSGIGSGSGGGIGPGTGPGVGPGIGGGYGGGVYRVGGGVSAPRAIYDPEPEYSDEARKARYQGSVILVLVVAPDGSTRNIQIQRSLGMGLDEKAIDAVRKWRFSPGLKDGRPVAVLVSVEVNFRMY